jgi:hypothetical protein
MPITGGLKNLITKMKGWEKSKTPKTGGCEMSNARTGGWEKLKAKNWRFRKIN